MLLNVTLLLPSTKLCQNGDCVWEMFSTRTFWLLYIVQGIGPVLPAAYHAGPCLAERCSKTYCVKLTITSAVVSSASKDVNPGSAYKPRGICLLVNQLVGVGLPVRQIIAGKIDSSGELYRYIRQSSRLQDGTDGIRLIEHNLRTSQ